MYIRNDIEIRWKPCGTPPPPDVAHLGNDQNY